MAQGASEGKRSGGSRLGAGRRLVADPQLGAAIVTAVAMTIVIAASGGSVATRLAAVAAVGGLLASWHALRRHRPRVAGCIGLVAGAIAVVVGYGLGPRYLQAGEPSVRAAGASVLLLAGLVLLGFGILALVRGRRRLWMAPILAGALAGVAVVGLVVATGVFAVNVPRVPEDGETPADRGVAYDDVAMRTADGVRLTGWYVPSRNGAAVIVRHGSGSSRSGVLDHLVLLADAGFGVLAPNGRGRGSSEGEAMDFGWTGELDLAAAVDYLRTRRDVDPARIGIVGVSLGGMEAVGAAGADDRIAAVIAEGVTRRAAPDLAWLPDADGWLGTLELAANWGSTGVMAVLAGRPPPPSLATSAARASGTRFLLVTADLQAERTAAERVRLAAPDRVTVWTVPSDRHAMGLYVARDEWTRRVVDFLTAALAEAGG